MAMVSMIDYYSVMLDGVVYADFLELFGFDPAVFGKDIFAVGCTQGNRGSKYLSVPTDYFDYQFNTDWMRMSAAQMRAIGEGSGAEYAEQYKTIATTKANGVRVNFTGTHLKNMRIAGMDPETMALDPFYWTTTCNGGKGICDSFHVTRLDFAYDIVDDDQYANFPELIAQDLFQFKVDGNTYLPKKKGISGGGRPLPYSYTYNPDSVCVYIGTHGRGATHNEYIRIYDKYLERCQDEKVESSELWSPSTMYRGCKSWTRIELQTRDQYSASRILKHGTPKEKMEDTLHHIYDKFLSTFPYKRAPEFSQWVDLSKFAFCIIADTKELREQCSMMKKEKSIMELHQRSLQRCWKTIAVEIARVGIDKFFEDLNEQLIICSSSTDPIDLAKFDRFRSTLASLAIATDTPIADMRGAKYYSDHIEFKTFEELKAEEAADVPKEKTADELEQVVFEELKI